MSGPYCETCSHYAPFPIGDGEHGECMDPAKRITVGGNCINGPPQTYCRAECNQHFPREFPEAPAVVLIGEDCG